MSVAIDSEVKLRVEKRDKSYSVVATLKMPANSSIYQAKDFLVMTEPTYQTVQVKEQIHLLDNVFAHMNHSCNPTTYIDSNSLIVFAERDLEVGDEINFFYPSTEWRMERPFECKCGARNCIGHVSGAKDLPIDVLRDRRLNSHIPRMLNQPYFAALYPQP